MAITVKNSRAGFSLMELMIVIAILGLLMGTLGPALNNAYKKAQKRTAKTTIKMIKDDISSFQKDTHQLPAKLKDLIARPRGGDERVTKRWDGPYLEKDEVPEDPWDNPFVYKVAQQGSKHPYELYSYGPNGKGSPKEEWISVWDED